MYPDEKLVSVLIVNYNSGSYAKDCIYSLLKQQYINLEIILVDNASQDDSVKELREAFKNKILLIESQENLGFARANNLAASKASGDYLLILNPDTLIYESSAISKLVNFLNQNPEMGMVGPVIEEPRKGKIVLPRLRYPSSSGLKYSHKLLHLPGEIAWILGACMLVRKSIYEKISGFDPEYFLYGEDADICLRIRLAGYEIGYCDNVKITHVAGASEFGADSLDKWLRKKRGVFLFCIKNFDRRDALKSAQVAIIKSRIYLSTLYLTSLFRNQKGVTFIDKKHRLQATIIVAKEVVNQIKSVNPHV